ncbi:MAG: hypothetical protein ACJASQ_000534 [Crocinitomicaceae bacterium]|jgi:hypothetical protein
MTKGNIDKDEKKLMKGSPRQIITVLVAVFFVLIEFSLFSQQPSHFFIGSKEFSNTHIYSLLKHPNGLLYTSTNYGLFVYKNGQFKPIESDPDQLGSDMYNLCVNGKEEIFCHNLAGQIFRLENDRLKLVAQIPSDYLDNMVEITIDSEDAIIVRSIGCLRYDFKEWKVLDEGNVGHLGDFDKKKVLFFKNSTKEINCIAGGKMSTISVVPSITELPMVTDHFPAVFQGTLVSMYAGGQLFNHETKTVTKLIPFIVREYAQLDSNEVWALDYVEGGRRIHLNNGEFEIGPSLFSDQFISAAIKGDNGTIYLGTFNNGVIVIPNINSINLSKDDSYFTRICSSPDGIIVSERLGNVYDVTKEGMIQYKPKELVNRGSVMYAEGVDFGIDPKRPSLLFEPVSGFSNSVVSSIKDIARVNESSVIIATSRGLFLTGNGDTHLGWKKHGDNKKWWCISSRSFRCRAVAYDIPNKGLYYATQKELIYIDQKGKKKTITFKGKQINCNDLLFDNGIVWCTTQLFGILKISKGHIIDQLDELDGLANNYARKIQIHRNKLYVSHKSGFQIYDLTTKEWKFLGPAEGLTIGLVEDFEVFNDRLWVISNGKLISLPQDQSRKNSEFHLNIASVELGGTLLGEGIMSRHTHDQNYFLAQFDFRGVEYESEAIIQYRLIGANKISAWKEIASTSSEVEFTSLAPGSYEFQIRVKYRSFEMHVRKYPFEINPPFWRTWLFFSLLILTSILIVIVLFRIRLKRTRLEQKRQLDQQKLQTNMLESELKALRSQMNPHFIFNSLNSIQDLILREETENSYDYIVLFANLVRNTLNYSNTDFIPIEKELEFLDVYLSLEQLRFPKDFEYTIVFNGSKDIDVPSLLIQPLIENALVHGLLHKKGMKKLEIIFTLTDKLTCTIIDNGVGRKRTQEILDRQRGEHKSFATNAIEQRLELLNKQFGEEIGAYKITDLYEGEKAVGTCVVLTIPFRNQY